MTGERLAAIGRRRLWYFASGNSYWPAAMAHNVQMMKTCSGFALAGAATTLVLPADRKTPRDLRTKPGALQDWYAVPHNFDVAWCYNPYPFGASRQHAYALLAAFMALSRRVSLAYTRNKWIAAALSGLGIATTYELHDLMTNPTRSANLTIRLARAGRLLGIVCISQALADEMLRQGCPPQALLVAHSAVDLARFEPALDRQTARRQLGLPADRPVICYAGNLHHDQRGIATLLACAARLPEMAFVIVGGQPEHVATGQALAASAGAGNCHFTGHVTNDKIPTFLFAADALLMPYTTDTPHHRYISPLKLFEYMAAGRPVVASGLPALREVLRDGHNCLLVEPANANALVGAVKRLLSEPDLINHLSENGLELARQNTWLVRQQRILDFVNQRLFARQMRSPASRINSA